MKIQSPMVIGYTVGFIIAIHVIFDFSSSLPGPFKFESILPKLKR